MSQLLDNTKKLQKSRKNSKNIIGSELSTVMMQLGCISRHCTTYVLPSSTNPSIPTRGYTRLGGARPFVVVWNAHKSCPEEFVTTETYKDIICSRDGLALYLEMLRKKFPDAVITTYFLGSDQNEQLYAFIRVSYSHGRSRNLDAITIAYGIERRNVWSELSITNDKSVIAHTRGRSVLRPELKITGENEVDELRIPPSGAWKGSDLKLETLVQTKATRECIREGKERNLGVFVEEEDPDIRTGKKIALGSYRTLLQDDESSGEKIQGSKKNLFIWSLKMTMDPLR